jgi:hypothetical protein
MTTIACYLVLAHVPSVHNFDSIIPLFFDNKHDTGASENNRVLLSKSRTKYTRERNQITHKSHHFNLSKIRNHAPHKLM